MEGGVEDGMVTDYRVPEGVAAVRIHDLSGGLVEAMHPKLFRQVLRRVSAPLRNEVGCQLLQTEYIGINGPDGLQDVVDVFPIPDVPLKQLHAPAPGENSCSAASLLGQTAPMCRRKVDGPWQVSGRLVHIYMVDPCSAPANEEIHRRRWRRGLIEATPSPPKPGSLTSIIHPALVPRRVFMNVVDLSKIVWNHDHDS
jgi:hypothetical protein